jgi:hypothetical protein
MLFPPNKKKEKTMPHPTTPSLLVLILTSSNARLCRRAYQSLQDQLPHQLRVTVRVVVNSTNPKYAAAVRQALPQLEPEDLVETASTGLPGVGHNSCLDYFREHSEFDYLFHLDGDDVVYDTALPALQLLIDCQPVFVGSTGLDRLINTPNNPEGRGTPLTYGFVRTSANTDGDASVWQKWPPMNPFQKPLQKTFTPSRPILFGRGIFELPIPVRWSEQLYKQDDYLVFLTALENHLQGAGGIYFTPCTQIYVYNILNASSSTKTKKVDFQQQQRHFEEDTQPIQRLRLQWDSIFQTPGVVPMLLLQPELALPEGDHKTAHLKKHVTQFAVREVEQGEAHFREGRWRDAIRWWTRALEEGMHSGPLYLQMGQAYLKLNDQRTAQLYFRKAASLPKTADAASKLLLLPAGTRSGWEVLDAKSYLDFCEPLC